MARTLSVATVRKRVALIQRCEGDDEMAHSLEDSLYRDVLQAIADRHPDSAALARNALLTRDLDFSRWCA